ncbi:MAG: hypothetical protein KJ571_13550 [Bacteroidetes bacterium]|nr:hypothetical protein [Bacteroidota bacterium]
MKAKTAILFLLFTQFIFAQQGSNLFNFITSDINIQRNSVFRDLQLKLENQNTGELGGIDTKFIDVIIQKIKDSASNYLNNPFIIQAVQIGDKNKYILKINNEICNLEELPAENIYQLLNEYKTITNREILKLLNRFSDDVIKNNFVSNIVYFITYTILTNGRLESISYSPSIPYDSAIANFLSDKIYDSIYNELLQHASKNILDKNVQEYSEVLVGNLNGSLNNIFQKLNDEIIGLLNNVQTKIKADIKNWNDLYLKGNISLAATSGTGIFSGGTMITYKQQNTSLSLYTNINFNSEPDTSYFHLYGIRVSLFGDNYEFDFLGSVYFGKEIRGLKTVETGMGITYRFNSGITAGLAGFFVNNDEFPEKDSYSFGIMLHLSENLPSVTFGFTAENNSGEKKPLIQINYVL